MTRLIESLLESPALWLIARLLLVTVFVAGGLAKLIDFQGGIQEMEQAGLEPASIFNTLVILTLLGASFFILWGRAVWLAAGALGGFLILTILIVHRFWALPEPKAQLALFFALEHLSLTGGLIATAIAGHFHARLKRW